MREDCSNANVFFSGGLVGLHTARAPKCVGIVHTINSFSPVHCDRLNKKAIFFSFCGATIYFRAGTSACDNAYSAFRNWSAFMMLSTIASRSKNDNGLYYHTPHLPTTHYTAQCPINPLSLHHREVDYLIMLLATQKAPTRAPTCTLSVTPCDRRCSTVDNLSTR